MRLSRRMLVMAVLLTSGLMAASELPELLTLTDNVSNDYELASQGHPGCSSQQIERSATTPSQWLSASEQRHEFPVCFSPLTPFEEQTSPPLSILGVQRK